MSKTGLFFVALGLYLFLCGLNLAVNRPRIEKDLTLRTREALQKTNLSFAEVRFKGRDGEIETTLTEPSARDRIEETAQRVWGVRVATTKQIPERAPALSLQRVGSVIKMKGLLRDPLQPKRFQAAIRAIFNNFQIEDSVQLDPTVANPLYLQKLPETVILLKSVDDLSSLSLEGTLLILTGTVEREEVRAQVEALGKTVTPEGLIFQNRLVVVPRKTAAEPPPVSDEGIPEKAIPVPTAKSGEGKSEFEETLRKLVPHFFFDSVRLVKATSPAVSTIVETLRKNPKQKIRIIGYADATGPGIYNQRLSHRRANHILAEFIREGLKRERFEVEGRGATEFIADNSTRKGRAQNRRVEFRVTPG